MKRLVNGVEVDIERDDSVITRSGDVLLVRKGGKTRTAVAVKVGDKTLISYQGRQFTIEKQQATRGAAGIHSGELKAPMPGQVIEVLVAVGEKVKKGQKLLIMEAMKTQMPFNAPFDGEVKSVTAEKGAQVTEGALLAVVAKLEA
ncbi:MAG: acetyl-CoA carboxylase biotin carboxyl carrier protein subunit [Armatimonadetes bacterium]|nr:acetyl-CoA carboxylase biotin carboxyl carrier protein subunit [Armatimonadota bacterium]